jgi:hypothetical protein
MPCSEVWTNVVERYGQSHTRLKVTNEIERQRSRRWAKWREEEMQPRARRVGFYVTREGLNIPEVPSHPNKGRGSINQAAVALVSSCVARTQEL